MKILNKIKSWFKVNIVDTEYFTLYSSRKVIKNDLGSQDTGYYGDKKGQDVWFYANEYLKPYLKEGMTAYYEIVGYNPNGKVIQKGYDYGYENNIEQQIILARVKGNSPKIIEYQEGKNFGVYIYRITYTNPNGDVFEFSAKQVQDWCLNRGLKPVEQLYYGSALELFNQLYIFHNKVLQITNFDNNKFLELLKIEYLEKDATDCKPLFIGNKTTFIPDEGIVLRVEDEKLKSYKYKSTRFLEFETKQLDNNESDQESEN